LDGTGISGYGNSARQKDEALKKAEARLLEYQNQTAQTSLNNRNRLTEINTAIENEVKTIGQLNTESIGVLARHEALYSIIKKNAGAAAVYIPLFVILLLLETLPLSLKVFSRKSIYDERLTSVEKQEKLEIDRQEVYETKQKENLIESLGKMENRLYQAVFDGQIAELGDPQLISLAEDIKTDILLTIKAKRIANQMAYFEDAEFGDEILIEVVDYREAEFVCQLPTQNRVDFSIKTLTADINRIGQKIGESLGHKVRFAKAFSSQMREISSSLPLLVQLENDGRLILEFEPTGESI
jgi:hypothetical protein